MPLDTVISKLEREWAGGPSAARQLWWAQRDWQAGPEPSQHPAGGVYFCLPGQGWFQRRLTGDQVQQAGLQLHREEESRQET